MVKFMLALLTLSEAYGPSEIPPNTCGIDQSSLKDTSCKSYDLFDSFSAHCLRRKFLIGFKYKNYCLYYN